MIERFIDRLHRDTLLILLLHGVTRESGYEVRNYTGKHVDESIFIALVRGLKREGTPVSMDDILRGHISGEQLPPRSFALTFDDGFEDVYTVAAPILQDESVPATFYVTTGWIGTNGMSWIDRIEHCLETTHSGSVILPWEETRYSFDNRSSKISILDAIRRHAKQDRSLNLNEFAHDIFVQCGQPPVENGDDPIDRKMSWSQVRELAAAPGFTIGGHTHSHAIMAHLSPVDLAREIDTSLGLLQSEAGVGRDHYSYPEGASFSYSDDVIAALQRRGVRCCPTAIDGVNTGSESLFDLKRVLVG